MVNNAINRNATLSSQLTSADLEQVALFLTLPGIVGFALLATKLDTSQSVPCYLWEAGLVVHQKSLWVTSLAQVVRSMPERVSQMEFAFGRYRFYVRRIHSVGEGIVVIQSADSPSLREQSAIVLPFCQVLREHCLAVLQVISQYHPIDLEMPLELALAEPESPVEIAQEEVEHLEPAVTPPSALERVSSAADRPTILQRGKVVASLNQWLGNVNRYLGKTWVQRAIERSSANLTALTELQFERSAIAYWKGAEYLSEEEVLILVEWMQDFRQDCSKILRNCDRLIPLEGLTEEEIEILFPRS